MKKTLLAAALMVGFAGVAQAETSVTLYGVVDGGIGYQRVKGNTEDGSAKATRTGLLSGVQRGNRWGLRGSEDLGDGLRFIFQLESGFDIATGAQQQGKVNGNDRLFGREAHFGLAGDNWGQLTFGRQTTVSSLYMPGVGSPFGASFLQANMGATFSSVNTTRYDNMIQYQTPSFAGFQAGLGYSFNTNGNQDATYKVGGTKYKSNEKAWTAALRYANGPVAVGLSYDQKKPDKYYGVANINDPISDRKTVREWILAGSYDFEVAKLYLAGGQVRHGLFTPQGYLDGQDFLGGSSTVGMLGGVGKGFKANNYTVGVSAPVGAGEIMASWAMSDVRKAADGYNKSDMKDQQIYSLGYTYPLSKRTNVYALGSYAKNVHYAPKLKSTTVGVGVSHQF